VTDHRINLTLHGLEGILDGAIDDFVVGLQDEERNIKLNNLKK
jgi:protein subunit release factor A